MNNREIADHEFSDVDRTGRADDFVRYLDERGALDFLQLVEQRIMDRLDVRPGGRYLDVGCGTGDDAQAIARVVGPQGQVVGIDYSEALVTEARKRAAESSLPVSFQHGDAHHLEFADDTFDGCRVERVLLHLADPQRAVREMVRVTRSSGSVVAFEPDWGSCIVDAEDRAVTRAVVNQLCDTFQNGWIGRQLPRLFQRAGLTQITVQPMISTQTDFARWKALFSIETHLGKAQEGGLVSAEAAAMWLAQLAQTAQEGTFFAANSSFLVSAHKP
jgi:ubiquinone/menaquinone biosynthesis C-methylase UbiE